MANKISQVKLPDNNAIYDISLPGLTVSPSDLNAVSKTVYVGTASEKQTFFKISGFGDWGTGNWYQKNFSMLISSRAGEMVWVSLAANDSNTSAGAFRLINRYSKIDAIFYNTADNSIYVRAKAWANNICAHILSNVNGDQIPTINTVSAIPETAVAITIQEFGIDNNGVVIGKAKLGEGSTVGDNLIVNGLKVSVTGSGNAVTGVTFDESTMTITATLGNSFLPLSGGTLTGTLYTSASTPLLIGTDGKVGMRAATADNSNVGQINVSNSWYPDGDQWGAQMSAYNGKTDKRNSVRVSHDGLEYEDENEIRHQVLHDGNYNLHIDPSAIGVYKKDETYAKSEVYNKTEVNNIVDDYLPLTGGTVTGNLTVSGHGLHVSGRYHGAGDDEGIIVAPAANGFAGLTLGSANGRRSVFYLKSDGEAVWRYNNGESAQSEIMHPGEAGTIALQSHVDAAKAYAETCASTVKSDILGGAEAAYNTLLKLKEALDSGDLDTKELLTELLNNYVTIGTPQTITGQKTFEGETKMLHPTYAPTMNDIASGVGCSLKNSRACDNQLIAAEIFAPYTSKTDEVLNMTSTPHVLPFYAISGVSEGKITGKTLLGKINSNGWEGNVKGDLKGTADKAIALTSGAGSSTKPVYFSSEGKPVQCGDTLGVNISGKAAVADSATNASYATYFGLQTTSNLAGTANVLSTRASSWNGAGPTSIKSLPWKQAFIDSSISTDSGDFVLGLRPSEYSSGGTELCMFIDGDYYAMGNKVLNTANYSTTLDGRYAQKTSLAAVATSGKYSDLTGTPSLATVATTGKYSDLTGKPSLATVATTGSYNDLKDKPSHDYLSLMGGIVRGDVGVTGKVTQGTTSDDSTISSMNRFQSDLYVQGDGSAPNSPKVAGFYLGKSTSDDNRHMDIVSGGEYSYIDFNQASAEVDYNVRLIANVESGFTEFQWGGAGADRTLNVAGTLKQAGYPVATQAWVSGQGYLTSLPSHTHDDRYFTEGEADNRFAPISHNHDDRYYTESESNSRFSPIGHTHDERYYTETEADNRFVNASGDTMTGNFLIEKANPYVGFKDTGYSTMWYMQAYQDQFGFGPSWTNAVKSDKNGNMTVPGTVKVGNAVTLQYNTTNECLNFVFA